MRKRPSNELWFENVIHDTEHQQRIASVLNIREYLLRKHKVLNREDFQFKGSEFKTAKIILNTIKSVIDAHVSYCVGNSISISGEKDIVSDFNMVYKKGGYSKVDYEVTADLYKYGNAFEYVYLDGQTIKSKIINNEDAYPVYDQNYNYTHLIEYWKDYLSSDEHYIIYSPDQVDEYLNHTLVKSSNNLTGLPIHYVGLDKSSYDHFGEGILNDLIPIMDHIEMLLSKMDDSITTLSMNPIGVATGRRIETGTPIPKDIVGAVLNMDDEGNFDWKTADLDYNSIKLELDNLLRQFYAIAGIPSEIMGQANISNVSETTIKILFASTDAKAKKTIHSLKEGMFKRFEYFRKLLEIVGGIYDDKNFDGLDVAFNINRPIDTSSLMEELKMQFEMGGLSKQSLIDLSPYITDKALEIKRIEAESAAPPEDNTDDILPSN